MENKSILELHNQFKFLRKLANEQYDQIESIIRLGGLAEHGFKELSIHLELNASAYDMKEIHEKLSETIDQLLGRG